VAKNSRKDRIGALSSKESASLQRKGKE